MRRSRRSKSKSLRRLKSYLPKILLVLIGGLAIGGGIYISTKKSPDDHYKAGIALQEKGDLKGATIEFKNAIQGMPKNAAARYHLGQVHFSNGDYLSAEKELKKALDLGLKDPGTVAIYARTLLYLSDYRRLLEEIKTEEGADPTANAALLALRARAQLLLKEVESSRKSLDEADSLQPQHPETLYTRAMLASTQNDTDGALALMDTALAKAPQRADFWIFKGDLMRQKKQNDSALQAYAKAVEVEPANIPARQAKVQLLLETSDLDKAEATLKDLRKLAPKDLLGRYLQAFIDFKRARYAEANTVLQGVLRDAPGFLPGHLLAGTDNAILGNKEAARFHLEKVLDAVPNHPLARKLLAATLTEQGDLNTAKELLAAFPANGNDSLLNTLQGRIALKEGNFAEAKKHFEHVPTGTAQNASFYTDLAASRWGTGDSAGAIEALSKAAELDTESTRPDVYVVIAYLKDKRFAEAFQAVDKLEKEKHNAPLAHNLRGAIYLKQENIENAKAEFNKALEIKPDYFPAAQNLAMLDLRNNDTQSARSRMKHVLDANPKVSQAWLMLAALDAQAGDEAGYVSNLEKAKNADEKQIPPRLGLVRHWLGKKDAGKALVEARSALDTTGRPEFYEYIGLALAIQKDYVNALATFSKWVEAQPKNPLAYFRLAQEQLRAKNHTEGMQSLDKALALRSDFLEAQLTKALLLGKMGRPEEGIKIARNWQSKQPKAPAGFLTEADIQFGAKKYIEAAKLYAQGAQLSKQGSILVQAFKAYSLASQPNEGIKLLNNWVTENPQDALVRHQLALAMLNANNLKDAAAHYRVLVRDNPKDLVAYNNLAWLLGELRDKDAIPVAEQALKLNPDNPAIQDTLGWIYVNNGQMPKGISLLEKAHAKDPAAPVIHWHLASALAKSGDSRRAKEELEKLIFSGHDFSEKAQAKALLDKLK